MHGGRACSVKVTLVSLRDALAGEVERLGADDGRIEELLGGGETSFSSGGCPRLRWLEARALRISAASNQ